MKAIAVIVPSLMPGGAERVASLVSKGLSKDYQVYTLVFDSSQNFYDYGGKLICLNLPPKSGVIGKLVNLFKRIRAVKKIKKELHIKVSISILEGANIVNILSKQKDKIIVSVHSFKSNTRLDFYTRLDNLITKLLYNRADYVVGVSNKIIEDLRACFYIHPSKTRAIYNPIEPEKINALSDEALDAEFEDYYLDPTFVSLGRVCHEKGHWHLIRAFAQVKKIIPEAHLIIIGGFVDKPLKDYLDRLVRESGLVEWVHFIGNQKNPFKYIKKADVYVQSSIIEGFGLSLCEALACGVPVISTDCFCGPREILAPETSLDEQAKRVEIHSFGLLSPVCNGIRYEASAPLTHEEECLAEAMIKVHNDKKLRENLIEEGRARARQFDLALISNYYKEIIE